MAEGLGSTCDALQRALGRFEATLASSGEWQDSQRIQLDRTRLDPLVTDGRLLLRKLRAADEIIVQARRDLA